MTDLMKKAISRLNALPETQQDPMAQFILEKLDAGEEGEASAMSQAFRERLEQVSVWTDEDVQPIKDAESLWQWRAPEWS